MLSQNDLIITKHAADKMIIEGITPAQVCSAISKGSRFQQTDGYLSVYTYYSVAWKRKGMQYKIKTVFVNR
ncbi:hypothetical protein HYU19_00480 [Candidatus Woesearchaeota archaeon]|nr:hypothetical protein [Candidatus Woesearchaeota archaeon]